MPPRGSRAGERGRGGRGGRGRGAASSSATSTAPADESAAAAAPAPNNEPQNESTPDVVMENAENATASTPTTASQRSTPASTRASQTPGASRGAGGRLRPKNIRRNEEERRKLEEARARDLAVKIKAEEKELRDEERRARRGRGRGRGGAQRGLTRRTVTASGPFSAISAENVKAEGGGGWAFGSGGGGTSSSKRPGDASYNFRYQPRRQNEARVNIDLLNGMTDGHAEDGSEMYQPSRYGQSSTGSLPVGLMRVQHEEAEVKVKTQAELEAEDRQGSDEEVEVPEEDGDLFVDSSAKDPRDVGMDDDNEVWHAAPQNQVKIKAEPGAEPESEDVDMADIPEAQPKAPDSPELKKKPAIDAEGGASNDAMEKKKRREKKKADDPEYLNATMDLESLLSGLTFSAPAEGEEGQEKDDQLYIFQLPPILPPLMSLANGPDGQENENEDDQEVKPKIEEASNGLPVGGGCIGKMNVRKSGKVEFDWGGTTLNVGIGAETEFLTSAVILEQNEDLENPEASAGFACGMGQVIGKYVLTPVWEDEEEWDPSIEDLYGNGNDAM
ncbi:RNA polymerase III RPC4-domain-containing protein [Xylariomycetidae sp. FL0641]|nr:RNA polymerase III RPC4-domain-containing protein [Xylariomycetidae sp. FL0641]